MSDWSPSRPGVPWTIDVPTRGRSSEARGRPVRPGEAATTAPEASTTWISTLRRSGRRAGSESCAASSATSDASALALASSPWIKEWCSSRTSPTPLVAKANATAATATRVTRPRTVEISGQWRRATGWTPAGSSTVGRQAVADAAHGLQRGPPEGLVDLAPQVADVDLDDVGVALEVLTPDVRHDLALVDRLAREAHEVLEERELPRSELHLVVTPAAPVLGRVQRQVTGGENGRAGAPPAPQQSPDPRHEDDEGERLGQEV